MPPLMRSGPCETADEPVAAMGFCFGGLCVLDLARSRSNIAGVVSLHGLLMPADNLPAPEISAKVLVLHGYDDPMVPPDQVVSFATEMTNAGCDWQLHAYGQTLHAFTNPEANDPDFGTVYSATASRRAYGALDDFLAEVLPDGLVRSLRGAPSGDLRLRHQADCPSTTEGGTPGPGAHS